MVDSYKNPEWVDKILSILEEAKQDKKNWEKEQRKKAINEQPIPEEKIVLSPKEEGLLWFEMLKVLNKIKPKNEIIPFPSYFEKVCSKFSMTKAKAWNCLFFLAEFGLIEIVKFHGIKLLFKTEYSLKINRN